MIDNDEREVPDDAIINTAGVFSLISGIASILILVGFIIRIDIMFWIGIIGFSAGIIGLVSLFILILIIMHKHHM